MVTVSDLILYKKNCCFAIPHADFTTLCKDVYGEKSEVTITSDTLLVIAEDGKYKDESDMKKDFTDALKIEIESLHTTAFDDNVYVISKASF